MIPSQDKVPTLGVEPPKKRREVPHRYVAVGSGALQIVRNMLKRDAEGGSAARGETLACLDDVTRAISDSMQEELARLDRESIALPVRVEGGSGDSLMLLAADHELVLSTHDGTLAEMEQIAAALNRSVSQEEGFCALVNRSTVQLQDDVTRESYIANTGKMLDDGVYVVEGAYVDVKGRLLLVDSASLSPVAGTVAVYTPLELTSRAYIRLSDVGGIFFDYD